MNDAVVLGPVALFIVLFRVTLDEMELPDVPGMNLLDPPCSFMDLRKVVELVLVLMSCWDLI